MELYTQRRRNISNAWRDVRTHARGCAPDCAALPDDGALVAAFGAAPDSTEQRGVIENGEYLSHQLALEGGPSGVCPTYPTYRT